MLQPAPTPLSSTTATASAAQTPFTSYAPTPRSEPIPTTRFVTVTEATTIFLQYLVQIASDFLGKPIVGAVISIPPYFTENQRDAFLKAAEGAAINVLQLVDEVGAIASATTSETWTSSANLGADRSQLVVDLGVSSLSLSLTSHRGGLAHVLASSFHFDVNGRQIDDKLISYFAKDFTKKNKVPLQVCPASKVSEKRAEAKLRLAVEHTKRTLSASPGAATCSVESLCDGLDYTGSINRMRLDLEMRPIYAAVTSKVRELLASAGVNGQYVDEIVYVGGTTCLPGLNEHLCLEGGFAESVTTPFSAGTIAGGGVGDPTEILARGCALQAEVLHSVRDEDSRILGAFERDSEWESVHTTSRTIGLFPGGSSDGGEGTWICLLPKETPLPARRAVTFDVGLSEGSKTFAFEIWEVTEDVKVERIPVSNSSGEDGTAEDDDDEDAEEEDDERTTKVVSKDHYLGAVKLDAKAAVKVKGKWKTSVEVGAVGDGQGNIRVTLQETAVGSAGRVEVWIRGRAVST